MKNSKYSVLFMRDDKNVKRFRLSPAWLKIALYLEFLLVFAAAGGVYAGYTFWKQASTLRLEKLNYEQRLTEAQVKLERLENVQQILKSYDPSELQTLLTATPIETKTVVQESPPVDLKQLFERTDAMMAGIENLKARVSGNTMTVSFDINNLKTNGVLSGDVIIQLMMSDGNIKDVDADKSDLNFQIQRFKRVRATFTLPRGVAEKDVFGIRLTIKSPEEQVIFCETYPLANILA